MGKRRENDAVAVGGDGRVQERQTQRGRKRAAQTSLDGDDATAIAPPAPSKRTNASTKRTYGSKMSVMRGWLRARFPELLTADGELLPPLPSEAVIAFFGHLTEPAEQCETSRTHAEHMESPPLSVSCVAGYRSALVDLYRNHALELEPALDAALKRTLDGYEETINTLKRPGLVDTTNDGNRYLKSSGYDLLADKLMKQTPERSGQSWATSVFAWSFFVLMWNLTSRSDSVEKIMLEHIDWTHDALVIEEQGHKGDQTRAEKIGKHVYANPYEPSKCPVLALAILLFSYPERVRGHQLFVGTDNKGRFGRALRKVIGSLTEDERQKLGCDPKEVGTHSLREGSSTYALAQVCGPNPVTEYLRQGRSLGRLKGHCIHFGKEADQLYGRTIAGLPFDSEKFGVLPPHFTPAISAQLTHEFWTETVPGFDDYPRGVKTAFPYLLATLIHHERTLRASLSPLHPVFTSRVFTNNRLLEELRSATVLSIGTSPVCGLKATGVPPHLAIAAEVKSVADEVASLKARLDAIPATVSRMVVDQVRESFATDGGLPLTLEDFESLLTSLRSDLITELRACFQAPSVRDQQAADNRSNDPWKSWYWGDGKVSHAVPKGWEFPARVTVKMMWDLWHFGNKSTGIRPYKAIDKQHDIDPKHHMRHHRAGSVMRALEALVPADASSIDTLAVEQSDAVFTTAFNKLMNQLYTTKKPVRDAETSCGTVYNRLCAYRKANMLEKD